MERGVDSVQGVLFLAPEQTQEDALVLWGRLFPADSSPDSFQRAPAGNPSLLTAATGVRNGRAVRLSAQVGRIDLFLTAALTEFAYNEDGTLHLPRVQNAPEICGELASHLKTLVTAAEPIRIALVTDFGETVGIGNEARELKKEIPGAPFPETATDVVFQFNSRRQFHNYPDIPMNRLCTWTAMKAGLAPLLQSLAGLPMTKLQSVVGLKIDVNSAPEFRLPSGIAPFIIDELLEEALAIGSERLARLSQ